jgi:hypothetical protein
LMSARSADSIQLGSKELARLMIGRSWWRQSQDRETFRFQQTVKLRTLAILSSERPHGVWGRDVVMTLTIYGLVSSTLSFSFRLSSEASLSCSKKRTRQCAKARVKQ